MILGNSVSLSMYVYHTGADTLALSFFFGIRHHVNPHVERQKSWAPSVMRTGHILNGQRRTADKPLLDWSMLADFAPAKLPACFRD